MMIQSELLPVFYVSKPVLVQNLLCENEFDVDENKIVFYGTHFHINGFQQRFALTQRQKTSSK